MESGLLLFRGRHSAIKLRGLSLATGIYRINQLRLFLIGKHSHLLRRRL